MPLDLRAAQSLVTLNTRLQKAVEEVNNLSSQLVSAGHDVKLSGFNWDRPGSITSISPQGGLSATIEELGTRPGG